MRPTSGVFTAALGEDAASPILANSDLRSGRCVPGDHSEDTRNDVLSVSLDVSSMKGSSYHRLG